MTSKNRYVKRSKISEAKFREFVRLFTLDLDGHQIATLTKLNRNTVNRYLLLIRRKIAQYCERHSPFQDQNEIMEPLFNRKKTKEIPGAELQRLLPVFGILQQDKIIYTEIVPDHLREIIQEMTRAKTSLESLIHSSDWPGYNGIVDLNSNKYHRVSYGTDPVKRKNHLSITESFWSFAKRRLIKFHGIPSRTFYLHLKECEFRYNFRNCNIDSMLLKMFKTDPLS